MKLFKILAVLGIIYTFICVVLVTAFIVWYSFGLPGITLSGWIG